MSVAIQKFQGVEKVEVSLNQGSAKVRLRPDNKVSPDQIRETVEDNGFTPREARVVVEGEVVSAAGGLQLRVSEIGRTYNLAFDSKAQAAEQQLQKQVGKTVVLEGVVPTRKDKKAVETLQVTGLKTT